MTDVVLYILMRNDMASMTPGRAAAQSCHAANECVGMIKNSHLYYRDYFKNLLKIWEDQTGHYFGTVLVLGCNNIQMQQIMSDLQSEKICYDVVFGTTTDPTYPVCDGQTTHLVKVDTCAYILGYKDDIRPYVEHLDLY